MNRYSEAPRADSSPPVNPPRRAVDSADDQAPLDCPACGYDLRGFSDPRCPECGSDFDIDQLKAGAARINEPTWLDAADVWQPHQLLGRSLVELIRGAMHPTARLRRISVTVTHPGPVLVFLLSELWICVLCAVPPALVIWLQTATSPAASLRTALFVWTPAFMLVRWAMYAGLYWIAMDARLLRVVGAPTMSRARVAAYWLPAIGLWCSVPLALGAAVAAEFVLPLAWIAPTLTSAAALLSIARTAGRRLSQIGVFAAACCILAACAAALLTSRLVPDQIEPPIWIFVR